MQGLTLDAMGLLGPGGVLSWLSLGIFTWWWIGVHRDNRAARILPAFALLALARVAYFLRNTCMAVYLWRRGAALCKADDHARAEPLFVRAADVCPTALGTCRVYAAILNDWAALHEKFGHHEKAEPLYLEALAVLKEILGERHRDYAFSLDNLAGLYESVGAYEKAEPLYLEAVTIRKAVLGDKHPNYAASLGNLAECVRSKSYRDRATGDGLRNRLAAIGEDAPDGSRRPHLGQAELMRRLMGVVANQETSNGQAQMSVLRALASEPLIANALAPQEANNASLSEPLLQGDAGHSQVESQEEVDPTPAQDAAEASPSRNELQDEPSSGQDAQAEHASSTEQMWTDNELAAALQQAEESGEETRGELQTPPELSQPLSDTAPAAALEVPHGLGTEELGGEHAVPEDADAAVPEVGDGPSAEERGCGDQDADGDPQESPEELPQLPSDRGPDVHIQDGTQSPRDPEPQLEGQADACP